MPDQIVELSDAYLKDPARLALTPPDDMTVPLIEQHYYEVPRRHKTEALVRLLDTKQPELALRRSGTSSPGPSMDGGTGHERDGTCRPSAGR